MELWKSLSGMVIVEFTSADPEETMDLLARKKIQLFRVKQQSELTFQFLVRRRDCRRLSEILVHRGDRFSVVRKWGLYWSVKAFLHRPVLILLVLILLTSSLYLPSRIFFVTVDGNERTPDRLILSAAEACGIRFGASRKLVRSEKIKNALLSALPQLQWAGVNTSGCTAVISVRERGNVETAPEKQFVSNLIADRDGYILSATVISGTPYVLPGETVTEGQILISGYTDCGICLRASRAEGEIMAQTNREISAVMPEAYAFQTETNAATYKVDLLMGKKRINLWKDSRISSIGCGRMYKEYFISLPGGFRLPMAICVDRYLAYELQNAGIPEDDAREQLQHFSETYLLRQMVAGQILQKQDRLAYCEGLYRLESKYVCREMIGKEQREQIGVINGKRN